MTTGSNDFEPEYVSRCTDAVENIGRKYMVGIIFLSMVVTSLTMSELQGNQSSSYADITGATTKTQTPVPVQIDQKLLLHPASTIICKNEKPIEYRSI